MNSSFTQKSEKDLGNKSEMIGRTQNSSKQHIATQIKQQDSGHKLYSNQLLESSFTTNFPFFSTSSIRKENSRVDIHSREKLIRAKTPAIEWYNNKIVDDSISFSPKSILKKPNTASAGTRKQVHYNMEILSHKM